MHRRHPAGAAPQPSGCAGRSARCSGRCPRGARGSASTASLPGLRMPARAPDLPLPEGAEFRDLTHACAAGARRYRLYVPASAGDGLQGLVVMLHGCTQSPEDFAAGTGMNALAEAHRLLVVYPAQTGGDNAMSCWNWFRPGDQMRGTGEPAIIAGLTESVRDDFGDRRATASSWPGSPPGAPWRRSWARPTRTSMPGSASTPASPTARPTTSMSAFGAMQGQAAIQRRPDAGSRCGRERAAGHRVPRQRGSDGSSGERGPHHRRVQGGALHGWNARSIPGLRDGPRVLRERWRARRRWRDSI
jgi:hypothetical protein